MSASTLVFDPFSQEFFDDPYETYRWMRAEAPVYYSEEHDFYALTRHADVAAAFKDRDVLVGLRRRPVDGEGGRFATRHSNPSVHGSARAPAHAQYDVRRSMRDVTLHGVTIPTGKPVFLMLASANRDPEAWTDADTFDIDRNRVEAQNLGLGYGIHSCLGAALARMESAIALDKLLDFMPRYEVDVDRCERVYMTNVIGWKNVPVRVNR